MTSSCLANKFLHYFYYYYGSPLHILLLKWPQLLVACSTGNKYYLVNNISYCELDKVPNHVWFCGEKCVASWLFVWLMNWAYILWTLLIITVTLWNIRDSMCILNLFPSHRKAKYWNQCQCFECQRGFCLVVERHMRYLCLHRRVWAILGAYPKQLRKATFSFVMSVGPSVHVEQFNSRWVNFREILFYRFLQKKLNTYIILWYFIDELFSGRRRIRKSCSGNRNKFYLQYIYPKTEPFTRNLQGMR
jgi:hypothetical protein